MNTYIVYDDKGKDAGCVKAASKDSARKKAEKKHGNKVTVRLKEQETLLSFNSCS